MFGNLPVSLSNEIQTNILKTLKGASEEDIFALEIFKDFRINMYNNTIHELINWFVRMISRVSIVKFMYYRH